MTDIHDDTQGLIDRIERLSAPLTPRPTDQSLQLQELDGIRAVLFDIYGTLMISGSGDIGAGEVGDDEAVFEAALDAAGLNLSDPASHPPGPVLLHQAIEDAHEARIQEGIDHPEVDILAIWGQVSRQIFGATGSAMPTREQLRILAVEYECRTNPVWPMPGLRDTVSALQQKGMLLGIVSNAQFYTPLMFQALLGATPERLGLRPDLCAWSYQMLEAKPSTRLFQGVFERLAQTDAIAPDQVLYVGNDCLKDIWPAARLDSRTALFAGDQRSLRLREDDPRCSGVKPDLVITELNQIGDALGLG